MVSPNLLHCATEIYPEQSADNALAKWGGGRFVPLDDFCPILLPLSPFSLHKSPESPARTWSRINERGGGGGGGAAAAAAAFSCRLYLAVGGLLQGTAASVDDKDQRLKSHRRLFVI